MRKTQIVEKRDWVFAVAAAVIILLLLAAVVKHYTEEDAWEELLALDMSVSMEDLKAKGFIDVSDVMDTPNNKIEDFLKNARNRENCALKIANVIDGRLCAKILVYNKQQDVIKMWTMYTKKQQADTPGRCFSTDALIEKGNVTKVFLKNVPDVSEPISVEEQEPYLSDEILYSYRAEP